MVARKPRPKRPRGANNTVPAVEPGEGIEGTPEAARLGLKLGFGLRGMGIHLGHRSKIPTRARTEACPR
jgi:hypothetical protein